MSIPIGSQPNAGGKPKLDGQATKAEVEANKAAKQPEASGQNTAPAANPFSFDVTEVREVNPDGFSHKGTAEGCNPTNDFDLRTHSNAGHFDGV